MKKFFVIAIMYCVNICVGQDNKLNLVDIIDALNVGTLHYLDSAPDKARSSESMRQHFKDYISAGYKDADYGNKPNKELILSRNRQDFSLLEKNKIKIDSLLMNSTAVSYTHLTLPTSDLV